MAEAKDKKPQWVPPYGHFCWYELNSSDLANSASFYGGVFGWEAKEITKKPMPYTQFFSKGLMIAGMIETKYTGDCDPFWLPYVHSKKLEQSIKTIEKAGGKVHKEPTDLGHIGRFAVMSDPEGAGFALWEMAGKVTPTKESDKNVKRPETPFCWHELHTADEEEALKFYKPALAWATQKFESGYTMLSLKSDSKDAKKCFGGVAKLEGDSKPGWFLYIGVANADDTVAKVLKHGGKVLKAPYDVPKVGRLALLTDSQDAKFAIIQPDPASMPGNGAVADEKKTAKGKPKKGKKTPTAEKKTKASSKKAKGAKRKAESDSESSEGEEAADGEKSSSDSESSSDDDKAKKKSKGRGKKAKTS